MKGMGQIDWRKHRWSGLLGILFTLMTGVIGLVSPLGERLRLASYDLPVALHVNEVPQEAVLVYLDDHSHENLQQPKNCPWNRSLHAQLLRRLNAEGAALVVFDIVFSDSNCGDTNAAADADFARAIQESGNVVLAGEHSPSEQRGLIKNAMTGSKPYAPFLAGARGWGTVHFHGDYDFGVRRITTEVDTVPSLAVITAQLVRSNQMMRLPNRELWIHYYDEPDSLRHCSYSQVISNFTAAGFFKNRVVFVGARPTLGFSGSGKDEFATAYTRWTGKHAAGVEIHATKFLNLIHGDWLTRLSPWGEWSLVLGVAIVFGFGLLNFSAITACVITGVASILVVVPAHFSVWNAHVWFAWLVLLVQLGVALLWSVTFNSFRSYLDNRVLERSLAFYLPPARVQQILKKPDLLKTSAEKLEVSLMFTDIADFSTISDRTLPERLFQLLNKYFSETIPCVHQTDGIVVQLIGDAIFALWNAPEPQKDHQARACRAALFLRDKLVSFESANESFPLRTRVGLHAGLATVGNCGSADRFTYTALGAETNMAARLEGLNKYLGTQILASSAVLAPVEDQFVFRPVGHFRLKGSDRVLEVNELLGVAEEKEKFKPWRDVFVDGLRQFKRREFAGAEADFRRVLELKPQDGPACFYLDVLEHYRQDPPGKSWLGEINMAEK